MKSLARNVTVLIVILTLASGVGARDLIAEKEGQTRLQQFAPAYCVAASDPGRLVLSLTNNGTWGKEFIGSPIDCFTGLSVDNDEYPKDSNKGYLFGGALWVGAVVNGDTLVSVGFDGWQWGEELSPDEPPFGDMIRRSTLEPGTPGYEEAVSHEDLIAVYYDTLTAGVPNDYSGRPHIPLAIEVTQKSYAWSYVYTQDFVLISYEVENIGQYPMEQTYVGIYVDADAQVINTQGYLDDMTGFLPSVEVPGMCPYTFDLNLAWAADNDGDLSGTPVRGVTGTCFIGTPLSDPHLSYNWWQSNTNSSLDFGPREQGGAGEWPEPFRDFGTGGTGTPEGDANKYYQLMNREIDYDQYRTASISVADPLWMYPNQSVAGDITDGMDTRYLLSIGPFDIAPGETVPFVVAYVAGDYFHVNPNNLDNLPSDPDSYEANLNFGMLAANAQWAQWVYDNPGVDTDGDGYFGEFIQCGPDTIWLMGDGVPDFRAASAPPAPTVWYSPDSTTGSIYVRWNGLTSETTPDMFSGKVDFEGYNVYMSADGTPSSYVLQAGYDRENYLKYIWNDVQSDWEIRDDPFTLEELRCLYAASCSDTSWHPLLYPESNPFVHMFDSIFYFEAFGLNQSVFGVNTSILKTYPDAPYPSTLDPSQANPSELTPDGYLKYFEYHLTVEGLLPGNCFWPAVTATDFGQVVAGIGSLETSISTTTQEVCIGTPQCCAGMRGNVDGDSMDQVNIVDLTWLVGWMFQGAMDPPCPEEADINGDGNQDIVDLTRLVGFLFLAGEAPALCP